MLLKCNQSKVNKSRKVVAVMNCIKSSDREFYITEGCSYYLFRDTINNFYFEDNIGNRILVAEKELKTVGNPFYNYLQITEFRNMEYVV